MKERIRQIMEAESMTPARFADHLDIGRAVISHILNGRNNPSLDVIMRILAKMPKINSDWLLTGKGNMYKDSSGNIQTNSHQNKSILDLFSQNLNEPSIIQSDRQDSNEYRKNEQVKQPVLDDQNTVNETIIYREAVPKKIKQIILYYTDNTFETFTHDS